MRQLRQVRRRVIHAIVIQRCLINRRRQPEIRPRPGHYFLADKVVILGQLLPQLRVSLAVALQLVLLQQNAQTRYQRRGILQILLHLQLRRSQQRRILRLLAIPLHRELRDRRVPSLQPRVLPQSDHCCRTPPCRRLLIQQRLLAGENQPGHIHVRQEGLFTRLL